MSLTPHPIAAPATAASAAAADAAAAFIVIGFAVVIAVFLRNRGPEVAHHIENHKWGKKSKALAKAFAAVGRTLKFAFAVIACLLFAVAGATAAGTFIGGWVRDAGHAAEWCVVHVVAWAWHEISSSSAPTVAALTALGLGAAAVGAYLLHQLMHLTADLVTGKLHHGGSDAWIFFGPMVFSLISGTFGALPISVYAAVTSAIAPHLQSVML